MCMVVSRGDVEQRQHWEGGPGRGSSLSRGPGWEGAGCSQAQGGASMVRVEWGSEREGDRATKVVTGQ